MDVHDMRAGAMDRQITLYEQVTTTDDYGEEVVTLRELVKVGDELASGKLVVGIRYQITATKENHFYAGCKVGDIFTAAEETALDKDNKVAPVTLSGQVWAERRELRGDERWSAQQVIAGISCKYRIRYRDDVGPLNVLKDADNREYDINAVLELGRKEGLELIVSARAE